MTESGDQSANEERKAASPLPFLHPVDLALRRILLVVGGCGLAAFIWPKFLLSLLMGIVFGNPLVLVALIGPICFFVSVCREPKGGAEALTFPFLGAIGGCVNVAIVLFDNQPLEVGF